MAKRPFLMTVDVEALPARAHSRHVQELIWGDFGPDAGSPMGVGEMLRMSRETGVPFAYFLDLAEVDLYGQDLIDVGHRIKAEGGDLQLHLHAELLSDEFWAPYGLRAPGIRPYFYEAPHAEAVIAHFVALFKAEYGCTPAGYRGGSFAFNRHFLAALAKHGVPLSSNHAYGSQLRRDLPLLGGPEDLPFRWDAGVVELPLSLVHTNSGEYRELALPMALDPNTSLPKILRGEAAKGPEAGPLVMLLHSWSLLAYGKDQRFLGGSAHRRDKLQRILDLARDLFEPLSVSQYAERAMSEPTEAMETRAFPDAPADIPDALKRSKWRQREAETAKASL